MERDTFDYRIAGRNLSTMRRMPREALIYGAMIVVAVAALAIVLIQSHQIKANSDAISILSERLADGEKYQQIATKQQHQLRQLQQRLGKLEEEQVLIRGRIDALQADAATKHAAH